MNPIEYTVRLIDGDYAHLTDREGGEILIALALLPEGADEGGRLLYENYVYTLV